MLKELINDPFYEEYKKYDRCELDYCILETNEYKGEITHKEALIFFMNKLEDEIKFEININKMKATRITQEELFQLPNNQINDDIQKRPYWYLFLEPPFRTNYSYNDFIKVNNLLFPKGTDNLMILDWTVDWSNYFDDGLEWWGARCISIYDKTLNRIILILASATD